MPAPENAITISMTLRTPKLARLDLTDEEKVVEQKELFVSLHELHGNNSTLKLDGEISADLTGPIDQKANQRIVSAEAMGWDFLNI